MQKMTKEEFQQWLEETAEEDERNMQLAVRLVKEFRAEIRAEKVKQAQMA